MVSVIMAIANVLKDKVLTDIMLSVIIVNEYILSVIMVSANVLKDDVLSAFMLSVIKLSVIMPNGQAPLEQLST